MKRCRWCNLNNPLYVNYHDKEWGKFKVDDHYLFEMLILESFQAGLSWECVLNKRAAFIKAYDDFDIDKVINYDELKIEELINNKEIIRNRNKIISSISNAKIFKDISLEYGSFYNYLKIFTKGRIYFENDRVTSDISDAISNDLRKRGMKYVGSIVIYAYLQAIGIINSHDDNCDLNKDIILYEPKLEDYAYEIELLKDPKTMSYNSGFDVAYDGYDYDTGCIFIDGAKINERYLKRRQKDIYFAYILDRRINKYVGTVDFHLNKDEGYYECGIVIENKYRHLGYFKKTMDLLFKEAKKRNIYSLYDTFEVDRDNTLMIFEAIGFKIDKKIKIKKFDKEIEAVVMRIDL